MRFYPPAKAAGMLQHAHSVFWHLRWCHYSAYAWAFDRDIGERRRYCSPGQTAVIEAMKMENTLTAGMQEGVNDLSPNWR